MIGNHWFRVSLLHYDLLNYYPLYILHITIVSVFSINRLIVIFFTNHGKVFCSHLVFLCSYLIYSWAKTTNSKQGATPITNLHTKMRNFGENADNQLANLTCRNSHNSHNCPRTLRNRNRTGQSRWKSGKLREWPALRTNTRRRNRHSPEFRRKLGTRKWPGDSLKALL